jgi:hypothetical protein
MTKNKISHAEKTKMVKKMNKSNQVRALIMQGWSSADAIAKQVDCSKALVHQIDRKMRKESDKKVKGAGIDQVLEDRIKEAKDTMLMKLREPVFKVGGNPIPEFLQRKDDPINPDHYKRNGIEAVDVIEAFDLNYRLGNVVKYVLRHVGKNGLEDLKKARWYLDREISKHDV